MKTLTLALGMSLLACARPLAAADQPPLAPGSAPEDRLLFSANAAWLTGGSGGGGAEALWLHTFDPRDVIALGAEYQQIANSHWTNGVLSGSFGLGSSTPPTAIYFEAHEGAGDVAQRGFHYSVATVGLFNTPSEWLTVQLEERRIDVDTSHGNLPKLGLSFHVTKPLAVSVSYADSAGGNLGTQLTTLRVDYNSQALNAVVGADGGRVAPAVVNLVTHITQPGPRLHEAFAGLGGSLGGCVWQLLADYTDLEGFKRTTVTLSLSMPLERQGGSP